MGMEIRQIHPLFVGDVSGIDITQPLTPDQAAAIESGMDRYAVLVFHDQRFTDEQQVAFSRNFGEIERAVGSNVTADSDRRLAPELADVSNLDKDHKPLARDDRRRMFNLGNQLWHSDSSFRAVPAKFSLLSGRIVTNDGGNTEFADMRAAYDELDERTKTEIEDLVCEHSLIYSRGTLGFADFTPEEKRSHIGTIVGWPMPEARAFIRDLAEHATQPKFVHVHHWRQYDLVIWDNRQTMHRVRRFDQTKVRDMRRTTIAGLGPTVEQAQAA
jgi:alpha-ketoglutarate-dependent 2,4-dichlorophenoxyacetate dioxygenase